MLPVCCFGELLLRLSPELGGAWISQQRLPLYVGGAELNVATALACWDIPVGYCTVLPANYLSQEIVDHLSALKIDTRPIQFGGERIGLYYLPQGGDLKAAGVVYDRAGSAFAGLTTGTIDWDRVLEGYGWFHFSAISPALNASVAAVCREALEAATRRGLTVSVDLNYRAKLWQWGKEPSGVMPDLVQYCDVVMGNVWAAEKMLGIPLAAALAEDRSDTVLLEQSMATARAILQQFPRCRQVANTFRFDQDEGVRYFATLFDGKTQSVSTTHHTSAVTDRVGSGDTFMAGLIWGNCRQLPAREIIEFASAAAFDKLFIRGDATTSSVPDIQKRYVTYAT